MIYYIMIYYVCGFSSSPQLNFSRGSVGSLAGGLVHETAAGTSTAEGLSSAAGCACLFTSFFLHPYLNGYVKEPHEKPHEMSHYGYREYMVM